MQRKFGLKDKTKKLRKARGREDNKRERERKKPSNKTNTRWCEHRTRRSRRNFTGNIFQIEGRKGKREPRGNRNPRS